MGYLNHNVGLLLLLLYFLKMTGLKMAGFMYIKLCYVGINFASILHLL